MVLSGYSVIYLVRTKILYAVRKHHNRRRSGTEVEGFIRGAGRLQDCLTQLETCPEKDVLTYIKAVLSAAHRVNRATDLDKIFQEFSSRDVDPSTQNSFRLRLGKIANYWECAMYLLRTAKDSKIFKEAEVKLLSLDSGCLVRCETGSPTAFGARNITSRLVGLGKTNEAFLSTVRKSLRESRVHAEVQIVCYYELHPQASKPRVICSSKDACYLCNLFIKLHGTFHIPRTHGNLYFGWRILPIPALNRVLVQLNKTLETRIREVVGELMTFKNPSLMLCLNENESTVFSFSTHLPKTATSVMTAEASGSGALEGLDTAQRGLFPTADIPSPGPLSFEIPPPVATTGTHDRASAAPMGITWRPPTGQEGQQTTSSLPGGQSVDHNGPPPANGEAHTELATGLANSDAVPDELANASSHARMIPINTNRVSEQVESGIALELEKQPKSGLTPNLDLGRDPRLKTGRPLEPVAGLDEPNQNHEPASDLGKARRNGEADVDGLQTPPGSSSSFKQELETELEQLPEPEPEPTLGQVPNPDSNQEQDTRPSSSPTIIPDPAPDPTPLLEAGTPRQLHLNRDQVLCLRLDDTTQRIPCITAGRITILPEIIRSLRKRSCCVTEARIHWLPRRRAAAFYIARPRGFVELDMFYEGGRY
ncbi:hypothetical protein N657DRAFT_629938 [Parathielavia appendiculata]|uniref:Uncharacterized protein n=1 Tax=Parathielavia appendiculata TaxID=2587402 RepID=A0AAN6UAA0_9PEZI|nr:hypothetical protein N657DRAFT_629938 [Parathielavia appendiculata]